MYKAQDLDLDRTVALKFLPTDLAANQSRIVRFIQEAKAASALNHPNIITVYEIGRTGDTTFISTEFVEGVTLRQHLRGEPHKLTDILDIAIQVTSALVAAHAAGIVHRDIKPDNIMVRTDGIVKLLDFGLAKLTERQGSSAGPEETTIALVNTEPGAVLGTVTYMSPEQAAGREVDARSDIWSLGVVLYEMVTSRAPFEGASKSHIIVAITDHEPLPLTQFAPDVPPPLEWIIAEALTKDRDERCQTAKEMLGKLKKLKQRIEAGVMPTSPSDLQHSFPAQSSIAPPFNASRATTPATLHEPPRTTASAVSIPATQAESPSFRTRRKIVLVLGWIVLVGVGFGLYRLVNPRPELGPVRMTALTTGGKISGEDINGQLSISPDGKYVVCAANDSKQQASLWIRQISTDSLVQLAGPENGAFLGTTFAPDGERIYYVATLEKNNFVPTLYSIGTLGGRPTKVLDGVNSPIAFSHDGSQFAFVRRNQTDMALMVANTDGSGQPRTIAVTKEPNSFSISGPAWSPDGKQIACGMFNGSGTGYSTVVRVPVDGGDPVPIGSDKWATIGRVIWLADGSGLVMTAQPEFSSIGTQVWFLPFPSGRPRRITNDLNAYGDVSLGLTTDSGTIATIQVVNTSSISVTAPNEDENQARQVVKTNLPESVAWTPDGKLVYASRTGENWDLWISNRDGSDPRQLTADAFIDHEPSVSSDGRYVVFQSNRSGGHNIWRIDIDGNNPTQLTHGNYVDSSPVCSADSRWVIFSSGRSGLAAIWKVGIDGGSAVQLTKGPAQSPTISPDGRLIAYFHLDEHENNQPKLSLIPFEGGEPVKTIALPRSVQPFGFAWWPDGRSVAYLDNSSGILNVWGQPVDGGAPKQLTNFKSEFVNSFAISRDGKIAAYRFSATRDIVLIKSFQ